MGKIVVENSFSSTTSKASGILPIGKEAVHKICSGQVVLTLAVAMKELLENSLDAGATAIDIRLVDQGSELLEVADNGSGIKEEDFEEIALKHHTSKLSSFTDLEFVGTFGFRGEALSSLCSLCGGLTVLTYHNSSVCATSLEFDVNGVLIKRKPCARQVGTTVTLHSLFSGLPVRRKEFLRHLQREFVKMTHLLYAYCLVSTGVRITCTNRNQSKGSNSTTVVATQGRGTIRDNIGCVFGQKQLVSLIDFKQKDIPDDILEEFGLKKTKESEKPAQDPEGVDEINVSSSPYNITGCISTCEHGKGRGAPDRQFFFVNSRPCEPTKVIKLVNEIYHQYNTHQYPFVFLDIKTNGCGIDVNVTPDKRKIFIENEKFLLAIIKASLLDLYKSVPSTYKLQNLPASYGMINNSSTQEHRHGDKDDISIPSSSHECTSSSLSSPKSSLSSPQSSKPMSVSQALARFSQSPNVRQSDSPNAFKRQYNSLDGPKSKQPKLDMFVAPKPCGFKMPPINEVDELGLTKSAGQETHNSPGKSGVDIVDRSEVYHSASEGSEVTVGDGGTKNIEGFSSGLESVNRSLGVEENRLGVTVSELKSPENASANVNECIDLGEEGFVSSKECSERKESSDLRETLFRVEECINHHRDDLNIKMNQRNSCVSTEFNDESSSTCIREKVMESDSEVIVLDDSNVVGGERELKTVKFSVSLAGITKRLKKAEERKLKREQMEAESRIAARFSAGITPKDNVSAETELQREITKDMFSKMKIIGQFNLGFVIAKLGSDLFIIDQHASDEKYNFETLQLTTSLQQQPLVVPQPLDLTAASKAILMENIEVFERNGFRFSFPAEDEKTDNRVCLTSIPYSRNWTFGREDVDELIFMLQDSPHANCRPSRVRDMFASRACRKSVMIGTALSTAEMRSLIDHMGQMDQPWNCPHGRPTMRHLVNLEMLTTG